MTPVSAIERPDLLRENPRLVAGVAFWLGFVFLPATLFFAYGAIHVALVASRQQIAQATVTSPGGWSHGQVYDYTFDVLGQKLRGASLAPEAYAPGEAVPVYFDPRDPSTSSLVSFSRAWLGQGMMAGVSICLAVTALIYATRLWSGPAIRSASA